MTRRLTFDRFDRLSLITAFTLLVLTVAFLGWQIESALDHNLRTGCSTMAGQIVTLNLGLDEAEAAERISTYEAQRISNRAAQEFHIICGDVKRTDLPNS